MIINETVAGKQYLPLVQQQQAETGIKPEAGPKFTDTLKEIIDDVNSLQKESGLLTEKFIKGESVDIHDVMIASEKAKTGFQLLMELRNKGLELYREIQRMQV